MVRFNSKTLLTSDYLLWTHTNNYYNVCAHMHACMCAHAHTIVSVVLVVYDVVLSLLTVVQLLLEIFSQEYTRPLALHMLLLLLLLLAIVLDHRLMSF